MWIVDVWPWQTARDLPGHLGLGWDISLFLGFPVTRWDTSVPLLIRTVDDSLLPGTPPGDDSVRLGRREKGEGFKTPTTPVYRGQGSRLGEPMTYCLEINFYTVRSLVIVLKIISSHSTGIECRHCSDPRDPTNTRFTDYYSRFTDEWVGILE